VNQHRALAGAPSILGREISNVLGDEIVRVLRQVQVCQRSLSAGGGLIRKLDRAEVPARAVISSSKPLPTSFALEVCCC
jgi:hypothetical protein